MWPVGADPTPRVASSKWRNIQVPAQTYEDLTRAAQAAHMTTQAYAARLLNQGMARDAALAESGRKR